MRIRVIFVAAILSLGALGLTDTSDQPLPLTVRDAIKAYNSTADTANHTCAATLERARMKLFQSLEIAKRAAMKKGNLEVANRIDEEIRTRSAHGVAEAKVSLQEQVIKQCHFMYRWAMGRGHENRQMDLLPDGRVGIGAEGNERQWRATNRIITIWGEEGHTDLYECYDGSFRGTAVPNGQGVCLTPINSTSGARDR